MKKIIFIIALLPLSINGIENVLYKSLNKKKILHASSEATLHVVNFACGIAGTYWGINSLIDESQKENPDTTNIIVSVMGGLVSGFGSTASGILGLFRMAKKIIVDRKQKYLFQSDLNNI